MRKTTKLLCMVLALACVLAFFAVCAPTAQAADSDYEAIRLKSANMLYPSHYYENAECTGVPVQHTFIKVPSGYPSFACDNNNNSGLTSKPIKFNDLLDNGGSYVPTCVIDLALGGEAVKIAGFGLTLRSHFDCEPLHIKIQVSTDAAGTQWNTVFEKKNIQWDSITSRWYFDETDAYMVRLLVLDLDEVDLAAEGDYYDKIEGDQTRFAYSEVDVYVKTGEGGNGGSSSGNTPKPTTPTQTTTRPGGIQLPGQNTTKPVTTQPAATQPAATQPSTKAPTTPAATQPSTKAPTTPAATQPSTKAPTTPVATQPGTQAPTTATTVVTEPTGTVDPSAPTEPTGTVDPSAPTVDPSAPTDEPTVAPTDEPTVAPTVEATEPEATTPTTDTGAEETSDNSWIIIVAIVAAAVIAGGAIYFIIKKKKA